MATDLDLLSAWGDGDRRAADALVRRHYDGVHRFFEIEFPTLADDLTQRTFLACVEARERLRTPEGFRAFLYGIARKQLLQQLRARGREKNVLDFVEVDGRDQGPTPSRVIAERQEQRLFLQALACLTTDLQIAVVLFYWEGLKNAEIAEVLELSVTAVTTRLSRARTLLREHVERLGHGGAAQAGLIADLEGWARSLADRSRLPDS
jgi:RNA polymerase sigma-70 factor (ECF subfamily)